MGQQPLPTIIEIMCAKIAITKEFETVRKMQRMISIIPFTLELTQVFCVLNAFKCMEWKTLLYNEQNQFRFLTIKYTFHSRSNYSILFNSISIESDDKKKQVCQLCILKR